MKLSESPLYYLPLSVGPEDHQDIVDTLKTLPYQYHHLVSVKELYMALSKAPYHTPVFLTVPTLEDLVAHPLPRLLSTLKNLYDDAIVLFAFGRERDQSAINQYLKMGLTDYFELPIDRDLFQGKMKRLHLPNYRVPPEEGNLSFFLEGDVLGFDERGITLLCRQSFSPGASIAMTLKLPNDSQEKTLKVTIESCGPTENSEESNFVVRARWPQQDKRISYEIWLWLAKQNRLRSSQNL